MRNRAVRYPIWRLAAGFLALVAVLLPSGLALVLATGHAYDRPSCDAPADGCHREELVGEQDLHPSADRGRPHVRGYDDRANLARPLARPDDYRLAPEGPSLAMHRPGSLSAADARNFYLDGERGIAALADDLAARGVPPRERALELIRTRNALRTHTRALMADREAAAFLDTFYPNRSLRELVASAYRKKGLSGDELREYRAESATRSNPDVNRMFGLQQ